MIAKKNSLNQHRAAGGGRDSKRDSVPFEQRYATTVNETIAHSGIGRTKLYQLIEAERLKTVRLDGRRLIIVSSLLKLLKAEATGTRA